MQSPAKKHFTLVELMVVILIILFLAGIAFIAAPIVQKRNGDATTRSRIRSIETALELYRGWQDGIGSYPPSGLDSDGAYAPMYLDAYDFNASGDNVKNIKKTMCQFFDASFLMNACMTDALTNHPYVIDGFESPFVYACPGKINTNTFDLISMGADKMAGNGAESKASVFSVQDLDTQTGTDGTIHYSGGLKATSDRKILQHLGRGDDISNFSF